MKESLAVRPELVDLGVVQVPSGTTIEVKCSTLLQGRTQSGTPSFRLKERMRLDELSYLASWLMRESERRCIIEI